MSIVLCVQYRLEENRGEWSQWMLKLRLFSCFYTFSFQGLLHIYVKPHGSLAL